jgi:hypothetical protein
MPAVARKGRALNSLIRYRYNTMAGDTPGGEWKWRIILEEDGAFEEVLVKSLVVNVPSFSQEDDMPVVGRKYHMACRGVFRVVDGIGIVDAPEASASRHPATAVLPLNSP